MREKRIAKRRSVRYAAWLMQPDGALVQCMFSDISETGARIAMQDPAQAPETFVLALSANGAVRRFCRVMWRNGDEIGVQFIKNTGQGPPADASPEAAAESEPDEQINQPA